MKKIIPTILLLMLTQSVYAQGGAGQAGEFLRWGVGARAIGLGRAYTAISDDASALYWNPAGLSGLPRIGSTFMFMHQPLRDGASINYLAGGIPMRIFFTSSSGANPFVNFIQEFNLGFGVLWHSLGEFEFFNETAQSQGSQNSITESAIYASLSYPLNPVFKRVFNRNFFSWTRFLKGDIAFGVTTKFINQELFGDNGSATSLDLGLKYTHFSDVFSFGFMWRDFNQPNFSYSSDLIGDELPASGSVGASLRPLIGRLAGLTLSADYAVVKPAGRERDYSFGVEYDLSYISSDLPVKIRFGGNANHESFTFGLNFSPELIWDKDWMPSADWTYANDRSRFDATGARYSFSVDRNPFTAKYWYLNAMVQFFGYDCGNLTAIGENDKIIRYLKNAEAAKNPGDEAFRYEAALRRADLEFLTTLGELQNRQGSGIVSMEKMTKKFRKVSNQYSHRAERLLKRDSGKSKIDNNEYVNSFIYYVQSLILSNNHDIAIRVCADSGRTWGINRNVFSLSTEKTQYIDFLRAFALYKQNYKKEAINVLSTRLPKSSLVKYLLGHLSFLEGDYQAVLAYLDDMNLNDSHFPKHIYLPITYDCTFGDEVLFLKAVSMFKLSDRSNLNECIAEFAKIPRFFPYSDFARFLTNEEALLSKMLENYEAQEFDKLEERVNNMIDSYIKSFSDGTLMEESYTFNYR